ncbi:amino acid carrier protein [Brachyspira hampsonii 30446]|uniref:Amino acid carrier protein n=1 Tax=Brachyspira hampsonii 30446 TaxID=1289135 RepID=A0A2U4F5R0_9SPIR|nr:sodium:alanine symporter family protein [Brachyspira hampsonii]EKV58067.1 amino acid carrier protein [Brachyspira hampsonii 30446]MBW5393495.1 sodium:alanine symporter family protein [Brachyspira hampsonii]
MVEMIAKINNVVNSFVWGPIMLTLLVGTGIYLSIITGFIQITKIPLWIKHTFGALAKKHDLDDNITPFQAVSTALASTVGTGNIAGVTTAIVSGGPGALFWMWFAAFFGMVTKYSEVILAVHYRIKDDLGHNHGGPMYYISKGANMPWLGSIFAAFAALACFGAGNMTQTNAMAGVIYQNFGVPHIVTGIVVVILTAVIIIGGIRRIATVTEKLVPFMCVIYIISGIIILIMNADKIPHAFQRVFQEAFSLKQVGAGFMGYTIMMGMKFGFARGVFSNEAGLGTAPMAHGASNSKNPIEQGLWGIFEVLIDTFFVCTLTGLIAIIFLEANHGTKLNGAELISFSFGNNLGYAGSVILTISLVLFAFSTFVGWSHYGVVALGYLTKRNKIASYSYRVIFLIIGIIGAVSQLDLIWAIADTLNGLMAIPNLIGLLILSPKIAKLTRDYLKDPNSTIMKD